MAKNIVLLSDGTGNSAGKLQKTNVWRLYDALQLPHPDSPTPPVQIAHYDDGVGSSSFKPYAIAGGALGLGLKRNVIDLYMFLCRNYEERDRIYAFGFSRGAFTIRVLVGLINNRGLVQANSEGELRKLAEDAFRTYRERYVTATWIQRPARALRNKVLRVKRPPKSFVPNISFLGLWDTVAAYGLPFDELTRAWNFIFPLSVPDRNLCDNVERACHVLSLDDDRLTFHPVLWNEAHLPDRKHVDEERLTQVWFSGVHSNVGGGYPDDGLANCSLHWMMRQAEKRGLLYNAGAIDRIGAASDMYGRIYDPRRGIGGIYRYQPRKVERLTHDVNPNNKNDIVTVNRPKIHESVFHRIAQGTDRYAPIGLPPQYAVVTATGDIQDVPAATLPTSVRESAQDAVGRANRQERVWNLVWWKRVFYFVSVFAALFLLLFPFAYPPLATCTESLCSIAPLITSLAWILPDLTKPWLSAYATHPTPFLIAVVLLWILLYIGGVLKAKINDGMRAVWTSPPSANAREPDDTIYRVRSSAGYKAIWGHLRAHVLPVIVAIPAVWIIIALASDAVFSFLDARGKFCSPTPSGQLAKNTLAGARFDPRDVCWASRVELQEGVRYRVTLSIDDPGNWRDGDITTNVAGFGFRQMTMPMYWSLPLRRFWSEPWYRPIARIGAAGQDEYPLRPGDILVENRDTKLVTEITARRTGELFVFVNDAVLGLRKSAQHFYKNNHGSATVTVSPVSRAD